MKPIFGETYLELAKEWISSMHNLEPNDVTLGSQEVVEWKCSKCGYIWRNVVHERVRHQGCPCCTGRKLVPGKNDFYSYCIENKRNDLLQEWDYEKNNLNPNDITYKSTKKVHWKCLKCQFEWEAAVTHRVNNRGCPLCAHNIMIRGFNDLETWCSENHSNLLQEWDWNKNTVTPSTCGCKTGKKVWWLCSKCGHSWLASISNRTKMKSGCPRCAGIAVFKGYNDFETWCKTNNSDLLEEWNYERNIILPSEISQGNANKVWWKCRLCGNAWETAIATRVKGSGNCPKCNLRGTSFPEQCILFYLSQAFEKVENRHKTGRTEIDIYIPSINVGIEYDGKFWHQSEKALKKDNSKDLFCKKNGIKLIRFRDPALKDTSSAIIIHCLERSTEDLEAGIKELMGILGKDPLVVNIKRDYTNIVRYMTKSFDENSLLGKYPEIAQEWDYEKNSITPSQVSWGSQTSAWWICSKCGGSFYTSVNHRTSSGIKKGCPYCAGKKVLKGYNDFVSLNDERKMAEWNYSKNEEEGIVPNDPSEYLSKSNKKVWWKCSRCGFEWKSALYHRTIGRGCPRCARIKNRI